MREQLFEDFARWLDVQFENRKLEGVAAFLFNLYEGIESFDIQVAGCPTFASDNTDWAVDQMFSSGEELFGIPREIVGSDWQAALSVARELVSQYLGRNSNGRDILLHSEAIAIGFVDGDLEVLWQRAA